MQSIWSIAFGGGPFGGQAVKPVQCARHRSTNYRKGHPAIMTVDTIPDTLQAKEDALRAQLAAYGRLAVAYSGGVDSSYLAAIAHEVLGDGLTTILADSPSIPRREVAEAEALATARGWTFVKLATTEFENEAYLKNDGHRCYFCKGELFTQMNRYAEEHGIQVLAFGEITDDQLDPTRLGAQAAREHAVVAPLAAVGLTKEEIRRLSKRMGLPTWAKASFACLSSRFPTGTRVDIDEMQKVEAAEEVLKAEGLHQFRARHHGDLVRIEIEPRDFARLFDPAVRERLLSAIRKAGYRHITVDLAGYRTGSTAG
jgi:uncharacterized protein